MRIPEMSETFLTPVEIQHRKLKRRFGAYAFDEVDALLECVTASYERVWKERDDLSSRVEALEREARFGEHDALAREGVLASKREADQRLAEAERTAKSLVEAAQEKAHRLVTAAEQERHRIEEEVERLKTIEREIQSTYRAFVLAALELIENHANGLPDAPLGELSDKAETTTGERAEAENRA
jgi:cell division initiation protein